MFRELGFVLVGLVVLAAALVHYIDGMIDKKIEAHEEKTENVELEKELDLNKYFGDLNTTNVLESRCSL